MLVWFLSGCLVDPVQDVAEHPTSQRAEIPSAKGVGEYHEDNPMPHLDIPHQGELSDGNPASSTPPQDAEGNPEPVEHVDGGAPVQEIASVSDHPPPDEVTDEEITGKVTCTPVPTSVHRFGKEKRVSISGTITHVGLNKPLLIEVVRPKDGKYLVAYSLECSMGSELSLEVPASLGQVYLVAFSDVDGDGPTDTDPYGRSALLDLSGVNNTVSITMEKNAAVAPIPIPLEPEVPLDETSLKPHDQKETNPDPGTIVDEGDPSGKEIANPEDYVDPNLAAKEEEEAIKPSSP